MNRVNTVVAALVVVALWVAAGVVWAHASSDGAGAAPLRYAPPVVTVDGDAVGVDEAEAAAVVARIVNDPRGWRTDFGQFTVRIVEPWTRGLPGIGGLIGSAYADERLALITADAWVMVGPSFAAVGGTLDEQRTWIVLHELGHLLGHDHEDCPGRGRPAPVMRPRSYELGACTLNIWPRPVTR